MDKAILIPILIWAVLTVVTVLKNTISAGARAGAAISFAIFAFIFKDDLMVLMHMKHISYMIYFKGAVEYVFISLAVVWPATLYFTQFMTESDGSAVIIKLAIFSAITCGIFLYIT